MALERDDDGALARTTLPVAPRLPERVFRDRAAHGAERNLLCQRVPVEHLGLAVVAVPHVDLDAAAPAPQHALVAAGRRRAVQLVAREIRVVRRADEVLAERPRPVLGARVGQRESVVGRRGKVRDEFAEGDARGARGEQFLRRCGVRRVEDAGGPFGGAGHALRGLEEVAEGGHGEGVAFGERGVDAAQLGEDDGGGELDGVRAGVETGYASAAAVGGGCEGGHDWRESVCVWGIKGGRFVVVVVVGGGGGGGE